MPDTIIIQQVDTPLTVTTTVEQVVVSAAGTAGAPGVSGATFSQGGNLATATGTSRYYMAQAGTLTGIIVSVGTAPAGASVIIDVRKNGASVFTSTAQCPTITAGSNYTQVTPDTAAFAAGDYYTIDIAQVGTSTTGANLVVQLIYV